MKITSPAASVAPIHAGFVSSAFREPEVGTRPIRRVDPSVEAQDAGDATVSLSPEVAVKETQRVLFDQIRQRLTDALGEEAGLVLFESLGGMTVEDLLALDVSAEATAGRIVDGITGLYGAFARQNPELDEAARLDRFESVLRGAVDEGAAEALDVLDASGLLGDETRTLAEDTISLVHRGLDEFFADARARLEAQGSEDTEPSPPPDEPAARAG